MVAEEFINLVDKFKLTTYVGIEDFSDRLNFLFSVVILIVSMMVVTIKSYFFKPLSCYAAVHPSGLNFDYYLENFCWVHGTITILPGERIPEAVGEWSKLDGERKITYYQWIPFILGLQCVMFYIPRLIWQFICYNKVGTDIETLINDANNANKDPPKEREAIIERISRIIEDMLFQHRDYRKGKIATFRRQIYNKFNFCVFSKHLGTWLVLSYIFIKFLYGLNVVGQLFLMKTFLGFNSSMLSFGYTVLNHMVNGKEWHTTGIFPRVTYCYMGDIKHLGASNAYVGQCALPINMLNEKIYVFLWFWFFFVGLVTAISIPIWYLKIAFIKRRSKFIKNFLVMKETYGHSDKHDLNSFIQEFLRHDGVFLIRMIYINAGDIVAAEIVNQLWKIYKEKYTKLDLRNFANFSKSINKQNVPHLNLNISSSDDSIKKESFDHFV